MMEVGWVAVGESVLIACFWAFWGSEEAFHEGWYSRSLWANVAMTLVQYLGPMLLTGFFSTRRSEREFTWVTVNRSCASLRRTQKSNKENLK